MITFIKPDVDQQSELLTKMAETFTELVLKPKGKKRDEFFLVTILTVNHYNYQKYQLTS